MLSCGQVNCFIAGVPEHTPETNWWSSPLQDRAEATCEQSWTPGSYVNADLITEQKTFAWHATTQNVFPKYLQEIS